MDYVEWADEYLENARRVKGVIEKKKALLNDKTLSKDAKKCVNDTIVAYRRIYRELLTTAKLLRGRAGESYEA